MLSAMSHSPLSELPAAPIDPIFAVAEEAKAAGPGAINATIGVILNEDGKPHTFDCVRRAAAEWAATFPDGNFSYPPLLGVPAFRECVTRLVFGNDAEHVASIAATGGTGALALNLKLLKLAGITQVILPVPTWPNHQRLLHGFDFTAREVPYLREGKPDIEAIIDALETKQPSAILLQACCHNPTGLDFSNAQWRTLAVALAQSPHTALLDLAYQGLGEGTEEDAQPARILREANVPLLLAWSASKNHSLYGLRTGLACAVATDRKERERIENHLMILTRELHSAAPTAGQHIVTNVQRHGAEDWLQELHALRNLLSLKRALIAEAFPSFAPSLRGNGMFAMLPFTRDQIRNLKQEHVFLTADGRINIAGIPMRRMEELLDSMKRAGA